MNKIVLREKDKKLYNNLIKKVNKANKKKNKK